MKQFTFLLTVILFLYGCAKVASPTGGPKDTTPPEVITSFPIHKAVNINTREISIEFNEYVRLVEPNKNIIISPSPNKNPKISLKQGKILEIEFADYLIQNTTYSINFGDAIVDNNESNKMGNKQLIFSTGSVLDSLQISGIIIDNTTGCEAVAANVYLYSMDSIPAPDKERPLYFTRTDSFGQYTFKHLPLKSFYVASHIDLNNNKRLDRDEPQTVTYTQRAKDSSTTHVLFKKIPRFKVHQVFQNGLITTTPLKDLDSLSIILNPLSAAGKRTYTVYPTTDSTHFYITKPLIGQTISLIHGRDTFVDSLTTKKKLVTNKVLNTYFNDSNLIITFLHPLAQSYSPTLNVAIDSGEFTPTVFNIIDYQINIALSPTTENKKIKIAIPDSLVYTNSRIVNEGDTIELLQKPDNDYGKLIFSSKDSLNNTYWVLEGQNQTYSGKMNEHHELTYLKPGSYLLYFYLDRNHNQRFDPYLSMNPSFTDILYRPKNQIQVKPNWTQDLGIIQLPTWFQ